MWGGRESSSFFYVLTSRETDSARSPRFHRGTGASISSHPSMWPFQRSLVALLAFGPTVEAMVSIGHIQGISGAAHPRSAPVHLVDFQSWSKTFAAPIQNPPEARPSAAERIGVRRRAAKGTAKCMSHAVERRPRPRSPSVVRRTLHLLHGWTVTVDYTLTILRPLVTAQRPLRVLTCSRVCMNMGAQRVVRLATVSGRKAALTTTRAVLGGAASLGGTTVRLAQLVRRRREAALAMQNHSADRPAIGPEDGLASGLLLDACVAWGPPDVAHARAWFLCTSAGARADSRCQLLDEALPGFDGAEIYACSLPLFDSMDQSGALDEGMLA